RGRAMNDVGLPHPNRDRLTAFGLGHLDPDAAADVHHHLEDCAACRAVVESLPDDTLSYLIRLSATPREAASAGDPLGAEGPPESDPLAGHPRYRVLEWLGAGGMGVVYKAQHLLMERTVALKVIRRAFTEQPAVVERFRREVKAAAGLCHPNIVTA